MSNKAQCLVEALEAILERAMDHPRFLHDSFEARDYNAMCYVGGDAFDWTMVAITADEALKAYKAQEQQQDVKEMK